MSEDVQVEPLDHTGDAGFVVTAPSLRALFTACAEQMTRLRCPEGEIRRDLSRPVRATGFDLSELLVGWLGEINGLGEAYHEIYGVFLIDALVQAADGCSVTGHAEGETIDSHRHHLAREIKAVTYHQAWVRAEAGLWRAQVIFDL